jgi:RimJ/RimL family protein N-acetyltransferase
MRRDHRPTTVLPHRGEPVLTGQLGKAPNARARTDVGQSNRLGRSASVVGGCGLHRRRAECLEIGYWVGSDRHRRGYATAAAQCLTDSGFACVDGVARIEIRMDRANVASAGVPAKLGYELAGEAAYDKLARGIPAGGCSGR